MNSYDALQVLNQIAATSSRAEKEEILSRAISDRFMQEVVKWAYDPFIVFGLTPPRVEATGRIDFDMNSRSVWGLLHALSTRAITGGNAHQTVLETMQSLSTASNELLWRILSKDLRCGITEKTVNKVLPGTIPTFDVMLAHKFEEKRIKIWPVAVEPKLDGVRVICLVKDGQARFFSRTGKPFPAVEHLGPQVAKMVEKAHFMAKTAGPMGIVFYKLLGGNRGVSIALDGEIVSGSFNKTVGDVRRKSEAATDAEYHIFDALPFALFTKDDCGEIKLPYKTRRQLVDFIIGLAPVPNLKTTPRYFAHTAEEVQELYQQFRDRGLEGAIVKPFEAHYHKRRNHGWGKIKNEESEDLRVVGAFEGEGKFVGMLGGLIVDRAGVQVRVGGGFSDLQRQEFWDAWKRDEAKGLDERTNPDGYELALRLIEVEFHEVTPDGSLRHPRFIRFRDDKDERKAA